MHPADPGMGSVSGLRSEVDGLRAALSDRDATIRRLETMVERQLTMLDRFDHLASGLSDRGIDPATAKALDRALGLLEKAIARAEALAHENHGLEQQLQRTLRMLEGSLDMQERMVSGQSGTAMRDGIDETIAKYDRMMERSLQALEEAYRASQNARKEIDDRDRLLNRTLDLLQNTVDAEQPPRRPGVLGRLFA
jgi:hypothetical protein